MEASRNNQIVIHTRLGEKIAKQSGRKAMRMLAEMMLAKEGACRGSPWGYAFTSWTGKVPYEGKELPTDSQFSTQLMLNAN